MGEDSRLRKGAAEKGALQIAILQMACATHEIFKSWYGLLGAPALSASLWFMVQSQLALRHAEHYLPLQREQCVALSIICDDERFLSSPTFPLVFIAGLTGGCPQDPTPCLRLPALDRCGTARQHAGWKTFCSRAHQPPPIKNTPRACSHHSWPQISV